MDTVYYGIMIFLAVLLAGLILGTAVIWLIKGHVVHILAQVLTKAVILLLGEGVKWLPKRWQDAIEARRPRKTIDVEPLPVPSPAHRRKSISPRTSGPASKGAEPMRRNPPRRAAYNPDDSTWLDQVKTALGSAPGITVPVAVMLLSFVLNALLLGVAVARQPILFVWMELLGALALGLGVYTVLRVHQPASRQPVSQEADYLEALRELLGNDAFEIQSTLDALRAPSTEFDETDREVLNGIRNIMSGEDWARFVVAMVAQFEANVGPFNRTPSPRITGWTRRSRRARTSPRPVFDSDDSTP